MHLFISFTFTAIEQAFTILSSFVSFTWNFFCRDKLMFYRRNSFITQSPDKTQGMIAVLFWRSCEYAQRIAAFALIITLIHYRIYFASTVVIHVLLLAYLDFCRETNNLSCSECLESIFDAVLKIFCYLTIRVYIQWREIIYYILFHIQNAVFIGIWCGKSSLKYEHLYLPIMIGYMSCFVVQTVCQIFFYAKLQPKIDIGSIVELQHIGSGYMTRRELSRKSDRSESSRRTHS